MDFVERLKQRAPKLRAMGAERIAPSATVRLEVLAGDWSDSGRTERIGFVVAAAARALSDAPWLAGRFKGRKGLSKPSSLSLRVGLEGGRRWVIVSADGGQAGPLSSAVPAPADDGVGGLEMLDLSGLGVSDWRAAVVSPRIARLVLTARVFRPQDKGAGDQFGLCLDYDQRLGDATDAMAFLQAVAAGL